MENIDCRKEWKTFEKFRYCTIHNEKFGLADLCPKGQKVMSEKSSTIPRQLSTNPRGVGVSDLGVENPKSNILPHKRIYERFHSYSVKFRSSTSLDLLNNGRLCLELRNNPFYRLDYPDAIVKVFPKSLLITLRVSNDIKGLDVRAAEKVAVGLINKVLASLPDLIVVEKGQVVSLHNAFVNHPIAKYNVKVCVDGVIRLVSDNSNGRLEFEAVSPIHAVSDSEILEVWNKDLITKEHYKPSEIKSIVDTILGVQVRYAEQIEKHLVVLTKMSDSLDKMNKFFDSQKAFKGFVFDDSHSPLSPNTPEFVVDAWRNTISTPSISTKYFGLKRLIDRDVL